MAYSDFTIPELKKRFHLIVGEETNLFHEIPEVEIPATLAETLRRFLPLAVISAQKKRALSWSLRQCCLN